MAEYSWARTDKDRRIAELKAEYYALTEADKLAKLREQFEKDYADEKYEDNPKIFVYTPTYNRGELLRDREMKFVINQKYKKFEYLIVGDCCDDDTEQIVKECGDERVKFINVPQRAWRYPPSAENHWLVGPVVAANTALMLANGKWIARIDDDDCWVEDHLETVLKFAIDGKWEFVSAAIREMRDGVESVAGGDHLYGDYYKIPYPNGDTSVYNPIIGGISTILFRSYLRYFEFNPDCWRKEHNRVNDIDYLTRMGLMGVRMGYLDRVELIMNPRPGSDTIGSDAYRRDPDLAEKLFAF
jgi:glycosyltransferase involved in cell wall biosynthesis